MILRGSASYDAQTPKTVIITSTYTDCPPPHSNSRSEKGVLGRSQAVACNFACVASFLLGYKDNNVASANSEIYKDG
jgi:hypothetical protein